MDFSEPWSRAMGFRRDVDTPMAVDGRVHPLVVDATGRLKVSMVPASTGTSSYASTTTAGTNAASVKSATGVLCEITVSNPTATPAYTKLYDKATAPVVGTDIPVLTLAVPAGATVAFTFGAVGKRFGSGIAIATTAAAPAADVAAAVAGVQIHGTYI